MDSVTLKHGYSSYEGTTVTDREISNLVGIETYKALKHLNPELYLNVTNPMTPEAYIVSEIYTIFSLNDKIDGETIKRNLVIRKIKGESDLTTPIVAGIIDKNAKIETPHMKTETTILWSFYIFFMLFLIIYLLIFHIWEEPWVQNFKISDFYGCKNNWSIIQF